MSLLLSVPLALLLVVPLTAQGRDSLADIKARQAVEAQRVEKQFTEERAAAYKMVRSPTPQLVDAVATVRTLLAVLEVDNSLSAARRKQLIDTLKWDIDNLRKIAGERRPADKGVVSESSLRREAERDAARMRRDLEERPSSAKGRVEDTRSFIDGRKSAVASARDIKGKSADGWAKTQHEVAKSGVPESRDYVLPGNWVELSKRRRPADAIKMTAAEAAIMKALRTTIEVDFMEEDLSSVIDFLQKKTGVTITAEKVALDEASVTYSTKVNRKIRGTTRTILKAILADLNLTYVVKNETILITTPARAKETLSTRVYYLRDLAQVADVRMPMAMSRMQAMQTINSIISLIVQQDPQSWQMNNPDASGTIVFEPLTMSLMVKQTAEMHFSLSGLR